MLRKSILKRGARWLAFAFALALLGSETAQASFIIGGNTHPEFTTPGSVNGYINFAVYSLGGPGSTATDSYGTGVAGANYYLAQAGFFNGGTPQATPPATLPAYIYFFQVLNTATDVGGGASPPISSATVQVAGTIGGYGTLSGPLAGGGGGAPIPSGVGVGAVYNGTPLQGGDAGGTLVTFGSPAAAGNPSSTVTTTSTPSASLGIVATNDNTTLLTPTSLQANFAPFGSIAASGRSYVFGYTSNLPPALLGFGSIQDDGTSAVGTIPLPTAVPEPLSIVMVAMALPLGFVNLRRRVRGTTAS
jgi:hypothetical protein